MPLYTQKDLSVAFDAEGLSTPPDFQTHYNYVGYMRSLVNDGISVSGSRRFSNRLPNNPQIEKKLRLCCFTMESLNGEYEKIKEDQEYAQLCVSWISVKSYYLLFNLLLIIDYLISGEPGVFRRSHADILERLKGYIKRGELVFSVREFNAIAPSTTFYSAYRATLGANLRRVSGERPLQILRLLVRYQVEDFRLKKGFKNFRIKLAKVERDKFLHKETVSLIDFFYWYRIKANYRDLDCFDHQIPDTDFKSFYENYFVLAKAFHDCLKNLILELSASRLMHN